LAKIRTVVNGYQKEKEKNKSRPVAIDSRGSFVVARVVFFSVFHPTPRRHRIYIFFALSSLLWPCLDFFGKTFFPCGAPKTLCKDARAAPREGEGEFFFWKKKKETMMTTAGPPETGGTATTRSPETLDAVRRLLSSGRDPASAIGIIFGTDDPLVREVCVRARVEMPMPGQAPPMCMSVPACYYALVAGALETATPRDTMQAIVRAYLYGYMAWSTDDPILMGERVSARGSIDAISRAYALRMGLSGVGGGGGAGAQPAPRRGGSAVLDAAGITMDRAPLLDLFVWCLADARDIRASADALFGGGMARLVGSDLMRERADPPLTTRSLGASAALPPVLRAVDRPVRLMRGLSTAELCLLAGWGSAAEPASLLGPPPLSLARAHPDAIVASLPADDDALWKRVVDFIDAGVVSHMPLDEGPLGGCRALAHGGLLPRFSQLFPLRACIAPCAGKAALLGVIGKPVVERWQPAFERVAATPHASPPWSL
jgi:hypothetical protein